MATWLLRTLDRLGAKPPPAAVDDAGADFGWLRQGVGWLAPATTAVAAVAAAAGAAFHDRPTVVGAVAVSGAMALTFLLSRRFAVRLLEGLDAVNAARERLGVELAVAVEESEEYRVLAFQDGLTGLPNRRLFRDRLEMAITHTHRRRGCLALLFLDIDDFKRVNDSFGHGAGDRVLVDLANRIRAAVRAEDTVARLGGDEFVVLLAQVNGAGDAGRVMGKILAALRPPFRVDGHEVSLAASVGVSLYPADGASADRLVSSADEAMYRDKQLRAAAGPEGVAEHGRDDGDGRRG